jgi:hypothetical protein
MIRMPRIPVTECDASKAPGIEPSTRTVGSSLFGRKTGTLTSKGEIRRTAGFRGVPSRSAESGHDLGHGRPGHICSSAEVGRARSDAALVS